MAGYLFSTNDQEELALSEELERRNAQRAASDPPLEPLLPEQLLFSAPREMVRTLVRARREREEAELLELAKVATPTQRAAARQALRS